MIADPKIPASRFTGGAEILSCLPHGNGHINDTFRVETKEQIFILQRINQYVFKKPWEVMENVLGVTEWIRRKLEAEGLDPARRVLHVIPADTGDPFWVDEEGEYWRAYDLIKDAVCYERAENEEIFCESAAAFGNFQRQLIDYPVEKLHETIIDFHNTPVRFGQFKEAAERDPLGRLKEVRREADFLFEREKLAHRLKDAAAEGRLPIRAAHNDTKLNNVMMDRRTGRGICVLDLDTVMPGFSVMDFGDAIRFGASTADEDEPDTDKVHLDLHLYEVYARAFVRGCGGALTQDELSMLPDGAMVITYEQALRFLADYLEGDIYYKTNRPGQNLDRARTQIRLLQEMEQNRRRMERVI